MGNALLHQAEKELWQADLKRLVVERERLQQQKQRTERILVIVTYGGDQETEQ